MNRYPQRNTAASIQPKKKTKVPTATDLQAFFPFFSFRYWSQSMCYQDGKTYVRASAHRLEDGQLTSEAFEGLADGSLYFEAVKNMQNVFAAQFRLITYTLRALCLPWRG